MKNPHLMTSHNWYVFELQAMFPQAKEIKASRGYSFRVDGILYDCSSNNPADWKRKV